MSFKRKAVAVVGATASGKSAVVHQVARMLSPNVEVICVDAMTVYRGMDIGTAKPTPEEQAEVRYHLIDVVDPSEEFTVAEFLKRAREATDEIWNRGHAVLYVGGTGLYGRAVIDDFELPGQFPEVRTELEEEAVQNLPKLFEELRGQDPTAASKMEVTNARRIVRALEVVRGSGRPFSSFGEGMMEYGTSRVHQIGMFSDGPSSQASIAIRFDQWLAGGLLDEVRALAAHPAGLSRTARQAVGYKELLAHVQGEKPLAECVQDALDHSRQLARRQRAWFRRDPRIEWVNSHGGAVERIIELLQSDLSIVRD